MRHAIGLFAITVSLTAYAGPNQPPAPPSPSPSPSGASATSDSLSSKVTMLAPIQVQSLSLTPIVSTAPPNASGIKPVELLVLDEAMDRKLVRIKEGDQESVNQLTFVNSAEQPVFVLAGEVIIGGKQDRIIGQNTIIPGKSTLAVPVFCVERGRWDNSSRVFTTAKALAHGRLRDKASHENQSEVWKEVSAKNVRRKTTSATDTYRKVATQQSDGTFAAYTKQIQAALSNLPATDRARMVGYAVAVNGRVATVDVFDSPALFKKLEPKLVKSYVTEAIDVAAVKNVKPPTTSDIKAFIADAEKAEEVPSYDNNASTTKAKRGDRASKSRVDLKPAKGAPAPKVYENYQAK